MTNEKSADCRSSCNGLSHFFQEAGCHGNEKIGNHTGPPFIREREELDGTKILRILVREQKGSCVSDLP